MDRIFVICKLAMKWYLMRMCTSWLCSFKESLSRDSEEVIINSYNGNFSVHISAITVEPR